MDESKIKENNKFEENKKINENESNDIENLRSNFKLIGNEPMRLIESDNEKIENTIVNQKIKETKIDDNEIIDIENDLIEIENDTKYKPFSTTGQVLIALNGTIEQSDLSTVNDKSKISKIDDKLIRSTESNDNKTELLINNEKTRMVNNKKIIEEIEIKDSDDIIAIDDDKSDFQLTKQDKTSIDLGKQVINCDDQRATTSKTDDDKIDVLEKTVKDIEDNQKATKSKTDDDDRMDILENKLKAMEEITDLDDFEIKIKEQLNKSNEKGLNDDIFKLKEHLKENGGFGDFGIKSLANDYYLMICKEENLDGKFKIFKEFGFEIASHLIKNPKISLNTSEIAYRKSEIKKTKKEIYKLDKKINKLKNKELSLDDLVAEDDNIINEIDKMSNKIIKLYKKLRNLQNRPVYFGQEMIDFSELTNYTELNQLLKKTILSDFKKNNVLPDFNQVDEIVTPYSKENKIQLDSRSIFEKICLMFKKHRGNQIEERFESILNDDSLNGHRLEENESEELKAKLNEQNNFKDKIDEIIREYSKKKSSLTSINDIEDSDDDEDSKDSKYDKSDIDEEDFDTLSEDLDEFFSKTPPSIKSPKKDDHQSTSIENNSDKIKTSNNLQSTNSNQSTTNKKSKPSSTITRIHQLEDDSTDSGSFILNTKNSFLFTEKDSDDEVEILSDNPKTDSKTNSKTTCLEQDNKSKFVSNKFVLVFNVQDSTDSMDTVFNEQRGDKTNLDENFNEIENKNQSNKKLKANETKESPKPNSPIQSISFIQSASIKQTESSIRSISSIQSTSSKQTDSSMKSDSTVIENSRKRKIMSDDEDDCIILE